MSANVVLNCRVVCGSQNAFCARPPTPLEDPVSDVPGIASTCTFAGTPEFTDARSVSGIFVFTSISVRSTTSAIVLPGWTVSPWR